MYYHHGSAVWSGLVRSYRVYSLYFIILSSTVGVVVVQDRWEHWESTNHTKTSTDIPVSLQQSISPRAFPPILIGLSLDVQLRNWKLLQQNARLLMPIGLSQVSFVYSDLSSANQSGVFSFLATLYHLSPRHHFVSLLLLHLPWEHDYIDILIFEISWELIDWLIACYLQ